MAIDQGLGFTGLFDKEEEERKRRARQLGISGGLPSTIVPKVTRPAQSSRAPKGPDRYVPMEERDRSFFKTEAKRASVELSKPKAHSGGLSDFYALSEKMGGQDKVAKRLEAITSLWKVYAKDYNGSATIFSLLTSPYSIDTIEGMLRHGGNALYAPATKGFEAHVPHTFLKATGIDSNAWAGAAWALHYANLGGWNARNEKSSLWDAFDKLTTPGEAPLRAHQVPGMFEEGDDKSGLDRPAEWHATRRGVTEEEARLMRYAAEATLMGLPIGKVFGPTFKGASKAVKFAKSFNIMAKGAGPTKEAATEYFGYLSRQENERIERSVLEGTDIPGEMARNPFLRPDVDYVMKQENPMYKKLDDTKRMVMDNSQADSKDIQEWMIEEGLAPEGARASGIWTWEWVDKVIEMAEEDNRKVVERQRHLLEIGAVPHWAKIGDSMDSPVWAQGEALALAGEAADARFEEEHLYLSYAANVGNVPNSSAEWKMYTNRVGAEGLPQAIYAHPLQTAMLGGGVYQGGASAANLYARMHNDPRYKTAMDNLNAYVDSKPFAAMEGSPFSNKPEEPNGAFSVYQATKGNLQNDPTAILLMSLVDKEVSRLVSKPGSPDYLLTAGHLAGIPYDKVEAFGNSVPGFIHASNLILDLTIAALNPFGKVARLSLPRVAAKDFASSARAARVLSRVARKLKNGEGGRASSTVQGSDSDMLIRTVYKLKGEGKRLDPNSAVVIELAEEVARAIGHNNVERVAGLLDGNAKFAKHVVKVAEKAKADFIEEKGPAFAHREVPTKGVRRTGTNVTDVDSYVKSKIRETIARRETSHKDVINVAQIEQTLKKVAADFYVDKDVFPYLRETGRRARTIRQHAADLIGASASNIAHAPTRKFLSQTVMHTLEYAPLKEKEYGSYNTAERVYQSALVVSGDVAWAQAFRDKFTMVSGKRAQKRMQLQLEAKFKERYSTTPRSQKLQDWADRWSVSRDDYMRQIERSTGDAPVEGALATRPEVELPAGEKRILGAYDQGDTAKQVVASEAQEAYKIDLYRNAMFAPFKTPLEASQLAQSINSARNLYRGTIWTAHTVSQPLRRYTVAMGSLLLFWKHAITDTFRTEAASPGALMKAITGRTNKGYAKNLDDLSPGLRDRVIAEANATYHSEMMYNSGDYKIKWLAAPIRDKNGNILNKAESAEAIRRVVQSEPYRVWDKVYRELGPEVAERALTKYFGTHEGVDFLSRNGHYSRVRSIKSELGEGPAEFRMDAPLTAKAAARAFEEWNVPLSQARRSYSLPEGHVHEAIPTDKLDDLLTEISAGDGVWRRGSAPIRGDRPSAQDQGLTSVIEAINAREFAAKQAAKGRKVVGYDPEVSVVRNADGVVVAIKVEVPNHLNSGTTHLDSMAVLPEFEGTGISEFLLDDSTQNAIKRGEGLVASRDRGRGNSEPKEYTNEQLKRMTMRGSTMNDVMDAIDARVTDPVLRLAEYSKLVKQVEADGLDSSAIRTRAGLPEMPPPPMKSKAGRAMHEQAVADYIDDFVHKQWMPLHDQLENIMPAVSKMAQNEAYLDLKAIEKLIEDNPTDNAILNTKYETGGASGFAGYLVGKAMYANKLNRKMLFRTTFNREFKRLTKDGMSADDAGRVASTLGAQTVNRVQFDLANALTIEAKHRWFAWFATKHRLYAQYMGKLAISRPTLAASIYEIRDWMEERNEEKGGVSEYDKYDLVIDLPDWVPEVGGGRLSLNLAPYMWLSDYPLESTLGHLVERVAGGVTNIALGREAVHPSPNAFGFNTGRWDPIFKAVASLAMSPVGSTFGRGTITEDQVNRWLTSKSPAEEARWNRLIHMQQAMAIAEGGELSIVEAFTRAQFNNLRYELFRGFRPYSGKVMGAANVEVEGGLKEFFEKAQDDSEGAFEWLKTRPDVQKMLNASMNPTEKFQLDDFRRKLNNIYDNTALEVEQSYDLGTLADDAKDILKRHEDAIDLLTEPQYEDTYNKVGTEWYKGSEPDAFRKGLGMMVPYAPVDDIIRQGRVKTEQEVSKYETEVLEPDFLDRIQKAGMQPGDNQVTLYRMMKRDYYNEPLAKFLKKEPGDYTTWYEESAARYLARGGEDGVYKQDKFLATVRDRYTRELMTAGTALGVGSKSKPFLASMSAHDKEMIGWNSHPKTQESWYQWAYEQFRIKKYQRESGISATSKAGMAQWEQFAEFELDLARKDKHFYNELLTSRLPLDERMLRFGIGSGTDEVSKGWKEFLSIVGDYRRGLSEAVVPSSGQVGVGPSAQTAKSVVDTYVPFVSRLAKANDAWYQEFRRGFTMSKFGFYWKTQTPEDDYLWWNDKDQPTEFEGVWQSETPWETWED